MLVGHFAVAFLTKRIEPRLSLGTLVLASLLPDILWPIFTIANLEYREEVTAQQLFSAPISHSLLMVTIWAAVFAGLYFLWQRYHHPGSYTRTTGLLFIAVLSHWVLDAISHTHLLAPGTQHYFGFELWKSLTATIILEGGFWALAILLYARATRPTKRLGFYGFWLVVVFLSFLWMTNIRKGPPPPGAVIGSLIFFLLLVGWAYRMNSVRSPQP
jgi:hypothetical protein